jgi:hypothetical protein
MVAIVELSLGSGIFAFSESVFLAIIACATAVKIAEFFSGGVDSRFVYGAILGVTGVVINALILFGFFALSPLSLGLIGVDLFEFLVSSAYRDLMVICTIIIQSLFALGLTLSRNY